MARMREKQLTLAPRRFPRRAKQRSSYKSEWDDWWLHHHRQLGGLNKRTKKSMAAVLINRLLPGPVQNGGCAFSAWWHQSDPKWHEPTRRVAMAVVVIEWMNEVIRNGAWRAKRGTGNTPFLLGTIRSGFEIVIHSLTDFKAHLSRYGGKNGWMEWLMAGLCK